MKSLLVLVCLLVKTMAEPPALEQFGHGETSDHGRPQYGPPSASSARLQARPSLSAQYGAPSLGYGRGGENEPANYEFQYDVSDEEMKLKFGHEEQREGEVAQGKYYVLLPDGRTQTVEYVADQDGFRPKISYEGGEGYVSGGPGSQGGYSRGGPAGPAGHSSGGLGSEGGYSSGGSGGPAGHSSGGIGSQGGHSSGGPAGLAGHSSGGLGSQGGHSSGGLGGPGGHSVGGSGGLSRGTSESYK